MSSEAPHAFNFTEDASENVTDNSMLSSISYSLDQEDNEKDKEEAVGQEEGESYLQHELDLSNELVQEYESQLNDMENERELLLKKVSRRNLEVDELKRRLSISLGEGSVHIEANIDTSVNDKLHIQELCSELALEREENGRLVEEIRALNEKLEDQNGEAVDKFREIEAALTLEREKNANLSLEIKRSDLALAKLKQEHAQKIVSLTKVFERIGEANRRNQESSGAEKGPSSHAVGHNTSPSFDTELRTRVYQSINDTSSSSEEDEETVTQHRLSDGGFKHGSDVSRHKVFSRALREERLKSKRTSQQRNSFFGASMFRGQKTPQPRRNTVFGIVQASNTTNQETAQNNDTKITDSSSLRGLQRARKAQIASPFVKAKTILCQALKNSSWTIVFGSHGRISPHIGGYAVDLDQFRHAIRESCSIPKQEIPDFMIRRIFDFIDANRYGQINANQFEAWLQADLGVISKVASPEVMHKVGNSSSGEQVYEMSLVEKNETMLKEICTLLARQIISCVNSEIVQGDWTSAFHYYDSSRSGKIELHGFKSVFRRKFNLPRKKSLGGCTDRSLRDVFFHLDPSASGRVGIDDLLHFLFRFEKMPSRGYRPRIRKGGQASRMSNTPVAFGRSFSDQRLCYSSDGAIVKSQIASLPKTRDVSLPSENILRLAQDRRGVFVRREKERNLREMESCTFKPNIVPLPKPKEDGYGESGENPLEKYLDKLHGLGRLSELVVTKQDDDML